MGSEKQRGERGIESRPRSVVPYAIPPPDALTSESQHSPRPALRTGLALFVAVCLAVGHAQRMGIIHRGP